MCAILLNEDIQTEKLGHIGMFRSGRNFAD